MVTVVAVAEAGAVTLTPSATWPPPPETESGDLAIERVGADSSVMVTGLEVPVPDVFVSVAVRTLAPVWGSLTLADQAPVEATTAEPICVVPSRIFTVDPASATSTFLKSSAQPRSSLPPRS